MGGTSTAHLRTHLQFSGRDLILIIGGLFLVYKAVTEIHEKLEGHGGQKSAGGKAVTFSSVIVQILLLDVVFSIDSVITAVGMVDELYIMGAPAVPADALRSQTLSSPNGARRVNDGALALPSVHSEVQTGGKATEGSSHARRRR